MSPPKQARSEETARRIPDAAQALLEREGLSGLSIPEVVRRARPSTGSFYARFEDKNALLAALEERWRGRPTRELLDACNRELLLRLRQHARLVCAFAFRSAHEARFATQVRRFHERLSSGRASCSRARTARSALDDERLARELTRMFLAYAGIDPK